jgi:ATP-binding cassette, subfamily B (MDR/TAP), member 1
MPFSLSLLLFLLTNADVTKAKPALNRLFYLFDSQPPINETKGEAPPSTGHLRSTDTVIEFRNVHFHYPSRPNVPILRGLSFKVRKGETVCLVGRSGCGKSTVISLLERFYDPTSGEILINGRPLTSLDTRQYRDRLALVSQETTLYQGSIRDNLLLGVGDAASVPDGDVVEACRQASVHDFVASLPDGYATDCGPRGAALSGGQRQRLAIARALLRRPEVLLLDEATSALDAGNEALVRDALARAGEGRTTVAATHQMETMRAADRIVVIEHGRVAEEGTFVQLIDRDGPFKTFLRHVLQR